jgi:LmbE family N-acetylglucosaminyl deacetylase
MISLNTDKLETILCLGAHADDIEIGCGGTLLQLLTQKPNIKVRWVVFSANGERREEALVSAHHYLKDISDKEIQLEEFKGSYFPQYWSEIKDCFEKISQSLNPDLILTHNRADRHQDHQLLSDLTWNTFRNHLILEYEIPKYDGDLGNPNLYVPLDLKCADHKVQKLLEYFPSQTFRHWFEKDTFLALMRLRAVECAAPSGYAEAFHARKMSIFQ